MKQNPIINAIKFLGFQNEETRALGLQPLPANIQMQCKCGYGTQNHLLFNKHLICPNNYIIFEGAEVTGVMSIEQFESAYVPMTYYDVVFREATEELKKESNRSVKSEENNTESTVTESTEESVKTTENETE